MTRGPYIVVLVKATFIGITGGSGAGKTTLCEKLLAKYPDRFALVQLDDYFHPRDELPILNGEPNFDHPDAVNVEKLLHDLAELRAGRSITVNTRNLRVNSNYWQTKQRIPVVCEPKPVVLVEGFLLLYDERVRKALDKTIWLEAPHEMRWERRVSPKNEGYEDGVYKPMYAEHAEPTRAFADSVIEVSGKDADEVLAEVERLVLPPLSNELKRFS